MAKNTTPPVKAERAPKTPTPCQCFAQPFGEPDDDETPMFTYCGADTMGTFAPGHDAKLKGVLIRAFLNGQSYDVRNDGHLTSYDPMTVAKERHWEAFLNEAKVREERKVEAAAAKATAKATAKAERDAAKAAAKAEKALAKAETETVKAAGKILPEPAKASAKRTRTRKAATPKA